MKKYLTALILSIFFITAPVFSQDAVLYPPFSNETPPANPDFNSEDEVVEYFEKVYRPTWDKLSEFEKDAIAFSSNLFQLNRQYHLDFSGKTVYKSNQGSPTVLLQKDWGITDHDSLVEMFDSLVTGGQSGSYKKLLAMLTENPGKSVLDIALAKHLSILEVSRLYYVRDTHSFLGRHDIEAWDLGRAITIMRWGMACDYISVEEATELCKPVVERLRQDYVSWYDFFVHYIQGRGFFGLYEGNSDVLMINGVAAASLTLNFIPLRDLTYPGENADREHTFTNKYTLCISNSPDYEEWKKVQKLYAGNQTKETLTKLCEFEEQFAAHSDLFFLWHIELLQKFGTHQELVDYVSEKADYVESLPQNDELYYMTMYNYMNALNELYQPAQALQIFYSLPQNFQFTTWFYYQYAYASYLMLSLCETQQEFDMYKQMAKNALTVLQNSGFEIGASLEAWLNAQSK